MTRSFFIYQTGKWFLQRHGELARLQAGLGRTGDGLACRGLESNGSVLLLIEALQANSHQLRLVEFCWLKGSEELPLDM